jgi:hypothetical protein
MLIDWMGSICTPSFIFSPRLATRHGIETATITYAVALAGQHRGVVLPSGAGMTEVEGGAALAGSCLSASPWLRRNSASTGSGRAD